jgi:hypothetical protein
MTGTTDIPNIGTSQSDTNVVQDNLIAGVESVTIPAGTYTEAMRLDSIVSIDVVSRLARPPHVWHECLHHVSMVHRRRRAGQIDL